MHEILKNVGEELQQIVIHFVSYASCLMCKFTGITKKIIVLYN
jgi:hypothetical protein